MSLAEYREMSAPTRSRPITKAGAREDLAGLYVRSSWEANYARYLNLMVKIGVVEHWEYEPRTFWFLAIKRGVRSYKPDFCVKYRDKAEAVYVEVKGYFDAKSKTKLKRMKKYHPAVVIEFVGATEYRGLAAQWKQSIPGWE